MSLFSPLKWFPSPAGGRGGGRGNVIDGKPPLIRRFAAPSPTEGRRNPLSCSVGYFRALKRYCKIDVIPVLKNGFPLPWGEGRRRATRLSTINSSLIRVFDPPSPVRRRSLLIFPGQL
jgi:hypothetical protein